jgi:hypothetical protein
MLGNYPHIYIRLQAQVQPITRTLLRVDLSIVPDFRCDEKVGRDVSYHGGRRRRRDYPL